MSGAMFSPGFLRRIAKVSLGVYLALLATFYFGQRYVLYQPLPIEVSPAVHDLEDFKVDRLAVTGGEQVIVWHTPPTTKAHTILYLHGNGGTLATRAHRFAFLQNQGYGVAALSYRGYGGSSGSPSEDANVADAVTLYDWLRVRGVASDDIVVFGESLGTGVAVQLATQRTIAALLLDSPYSSIEEMAAEKFPWLPVRGMIWDRYDSMAHIGNVRAPLLVLQGDQDRLIPPRYGRKLYVAANGPKQLIVRAGEAHTPPIGPVWTEIEGFLARSQQR
ncbi:MAG: alpha/beta hydrolase [Hyphomicrobiaceae bacterium]